MMIRKQIGNTNYLCIKTEIEDQYIAFEDPRFDAYDNPVEVDHPTRVLIKDSSGNVYRAKYILSKNPETEEYGIQDAPPYFIKKVDSAKKVAEQMEFERQYSQDMFQHL